jgi:hypothetical protein
MLGNVFVAPRPVDAAFSIHLSRGGTFHGHLVLSSALSTADARIGQRALEAVRNAARGSSSVPSIPSQDATGQGLSECQVMAQGVPVTPYLCSGMGTVSGARQPRRVSNSDTGAGFTYRSRTDGFFAFEARRPV